MRLPIPAFSGISQGTLLTFAFKTRATRRAIMTRLLFRRRFYAAYRKQAPDRQGGIGGLIALQKYVRAYLYWVLDSSSGRFDGLDGAARLRLFSRVFASVNTWQPLAVKEISCVGQPDGNTISDIFRRAQWAVIGSSSNNEDAALQDAVEEAYQQAAVETERQSYAAVLEELVSDEQDLDADMTGWLKKQIAAIKKETSQPLFKAYEISRFSDYILLQLRVLTEQGAIVRRCKNCGQYFITERTNIDYCQRVLPGETQTCFVIGPKRVFNKNLAADLPRGLYSRAYKKYQARLRRQGITDEEWADWKAQAKKMLDKIQSGTISMEEYTAWMER